MLKKEIQSIYGSMDFITFLLRNCLDEINKTLPFKAEEI